MCAARGRAIASWQTEELASILWALRLIRPERVMRNSLDAAEYGPEELDPNHDSAPADDIASNDDIAALDDSAPVDDIGPIDDGALAQRVWPLEMPEEWRDRLAVWQARAAEEIRSLHSRALIPQRWESEAATDPNTPVLRTLVPQRPDRRQKLLLISSLVVVAAMFVSLLLPGMGILSAYKEYSDL